MFESYLKIAICSAALGFSAHVCYFMRGEQVKAAPWIALTAMSSPSVLTFLVNRYGGVDMLDAIVVVGVAYAAFLAALFSSMLVYRVYFHPLRDFPGPPLARLSQFYYMSQTSKRCDSYLFLDRLHAQYGDYVRVGPNLLSVADPEWVEPIHNPQTKFLKAECAYCILLVFEQTDSRMAQGMT
jgi:hypothetical protein